MTLFEDLYTVCAISSAIETSDFSERTQNGIPTARAVSQLNFSSFGRHACINCDCVSLIRAERKADDAAVCCTSVCSICTLDD